MKKIINLFSFLLVLLGSYPVISWATPYNIASQARVSASSSIDAGHDAAKVIDGLIRVPGKGEGYLKVRRLSGDRSIIPGYS